MAVLSDMDGWNGKNLSSIVFTKMAVFADAAVRGDRKNAPISGCGENGNEDFYQQYRVFHFKTEW